ncbi:pyridoxamine 5'-phosphate oxidase family protein [Lapillicoccus jejuensis]|uniref:Nitroimidazol reductase NimA-like FMN-containing flavoprotein (Pyridoxamine 5'-phosphate oxidase superfamily) n=1 Tax=Lapillicoccus jejuensis TaxID=402171 RepID=A0A542DXZ3_9MICO|nr:pyridoxamine 5'-phosphate oxidase family protein [Lapillicoccus jejuensis]TQJ07946.1 nitroimidazol reductase NimA-like FMN-containing flavoprotein (pyridoxamine 5'-phosphate oxidase superfamily) [Lapillicoccus jejuensis]
MNRSSSPAPEDTTVELSERQCWELLRRSTIGRLAVGSADGPDIFPVTYLVDHGTVVFRTAAGTKLAASSHHRVAFEVDGWDDPPSTAWSVVLRGRAERLLDREENLHALALPLAPWQEGRKPWFVRVVPDSTTGRRLTLTAQARAALHPVR